MLHLQKSDLRFAVKQLPFKYAAYICEPICFFFLRTKPSFSLPFNFLREVVFLIKATMSQYAASGTHRHSRAGEKLEMMNRLFEALLMCSKDLGD